MHVSDVCAAARVAQSEGRHSSNGRSGTTLARLFCFHHERHASLPLDRPVYDYVHGRIEPVHGCIDSRTCLLTALLVSQELIESILASNQSLFSQEPVFMSVLKKEVTVLFRADYYQ
jgi:hypothetical protein